MTTFPVEDLEVLIHQPLDRRHLNGLTPLRRDFFTSTRWTEVWQLIFTDNARFYGVVFELPSTEMQEGIEPFGSLVNGNGNVPVSEVRPVERVITDYEPV